MSEFETKAFATFVVVLLFIIAYAVHRIHALMDEIEYRFRWMFTDDEVDNAISRSIDEEARKLSKEASGEPNRI